MKRILIPLLLSLLAVPAYAQQWDQVNGSMQVKSGPTAPLVIIDQTQAGQKIASFRSAGTEKCYIDVSGNLNCAGTFTLTGQFLAADGTAAAPGYSWTNQATTGLYKGGTNAIGVSFNGAAKQYWDGSLFSLGSAISLCWSSGIDPVATSCDTSLSRGAANRLDLATGDSLYVINGGVGVGTAPTATAWYTAGAGTTAIAPLVITNGTNLTAAAAGAIENDGASFYSTIDTTNGRRVEESWNYFRLTGSGTGITGIADFFGATGSGIPLVSGGVYEIEWHCEFSQATAGTATWTIVTATTALANLNAQYMGSNIAGIGTVGAPQYAAVAATASSSTALPVTGTEATGTTHIFDIHAVVVAGAGASNTRLRLTMGAGTATPLVNSYFRVRRLPAGNVGTFVS